MSSHARPRKPARAPRGFTLVEVLVALFILAILAGMAFRGVDALVRSKTGAQAATDRTLKLNTGMSQFEYDLSQMVDTGGGIPEQLMFDGATLRFARRTPDGIQLVLWTLQDRRWQRWASPPQVHFSNLQDAYFRSQQWESISANAVTVLTDVDAFQVYAYNGGWTNLQSTQTDAKTEGGTAATKPTYTGIRITLKVPGGEISREKALPKV